MKRPASVTLVAALFFLVAAYLVTIGVVELVAHPGLRLLGRCQCDPGLLRVGLPLRAEFEHVTEQFSLPLWRGQDRDGGPASPPNPGSTR